MAPKILSDHENKKKILMGEKDELFGVNAMCHVWRKPATACYQANTSMQ